MEEEKHANIMFNENKSRIKEKIESYICRSLLCRNDQKNEKINGANLVKNAQSICRQTLVDADFKLDTHTYLHEPNLSTALQREKFLIQKSPVLHE